MDGDALLSCMGKLENMRTDTLSVGHGKKIQAREKILCAGHIGRAPISIRGRTLGTVVPQSCPTCAIYAAVLFGTKLVVDTATDEDKHGLWRYSLKANKQLFEGPLMTTARKDCCSGGDECKQGCRVDHCAVRSEVMPFDGSGCIVVTEPSNGITSLLTVVAPIIHSALTTASCRLTSPYRGSPEAILPCQLTPDGVDASCGGCVFFPRYAGQHDRPRRERGIV